jgi:hypothetical protein
MVRARLDVVGANRALWPRDRSLKMLKEWCSFELHTVVVDTGAAPLEDDVSKE